MGKTVQNGDSITPFKVVDSSTHNLHNFVEKTNQEQESYNFFCERVNGIKESNHWNNIYPSYFRSHFMSKCDFIHNLSAIKILCDVETDILPRKTL